MLTKLSSHRGLYDWGNRRAIFTRSPFMIARDTWYTLLIPTRRTIENRNVGGPMPVLSFLRDKNALDDLARLLQHAEFAPSLKPDCMS